MKFKKKSILILCGLFFSSLLGLLNVKDVFSEDFAEDLVEPGIELVSLSKNKKNSGNKTIKESLDRIFQSSNIERCDINLKSIQYELSSVLDSKLDEMMKWVDKDSNVPDERRIQLGPMFVREYPVQPVYESWHSRERGWASLYQKYLEIKNDPFNSNWTTLNTQVRFLLKDDFNRVIEQRNMFLDHESSPYLEVLVSKMNRCVKDLGCLRIKLDRGESDFLLQNPIYRSHVLKLEDDRVVVSRDEMFSEGIFRIIARDWNSRFGFVTNKSVTRINSSRVEVSLDPGPFDEVRASLFDYIQSVWKRNTLQVSIQWARQEEVYDAFKVFLWNVLGGRPFVQFSSRSVNFFPEMRARSIPHEFGHVLGFRDHYYTVWNPKSCTYLTQFDDSDIMSNSATGAVTEQEWNKLEEVYLRDQVQI